MAKKKTSWIFYILAIMAVCYGLKSIITDYEHWQQIQRDKEASRRIQEEWRENPPWEDLDTTPEEEEERLRKWRHQNY